MSDIKRDSIIVSLKEQLSSDRENPVPLFEGSIGKNIGLDDSIYVFFPDTPPARGSYKKENFRLATAEEIHQFNKGKKLIELFCIFEEGDWLFAEEDIKSVESSEVITIEKGSVIKIDGILKNKDPKKSIMYFLDLPGYFLVKDKFRIASLDELENLEHNK